MKKLLSVLLIIAMLAGGTAFAEEEKYAEYSSAELRGMLAEIRSELSERVAASAQQTRAQEVYDSFSKTMNQLGYTTNSPYDIVEGENTVIFYFENTSSNKAHFRFYDYTALTVYPGYTTDDARACITAFLCTISNVEGTETFKGIEKAEKAYNKYFYVPIATPIAGASLGVEIEGYFLSLSFGRDGDFRLLVE